MGDQHRGAAFASDNGMHFVCKQQLCLIVERRERLIEQQQLGPEYQSPYERRFLAHSSG